MKICLLGDGEVGKTSLLNRYLGKGFTSEYLPTLGSNFLSKQVTIETKFGPKDIRFQIWDLAGQPPFTLIRRIYYQGAAGACLVFDLTRASSLNNLERWLDEFLKNNKSSKPSFIVLGNKMDLKDEIKISFYTVKQYIFNHLSNKFSFEETTIDYYKTSAKTGENVNHAFLILGEKIIEKFYQGSGNST